jgi:hypothetical protein
MESRPNSPLFDSNEQSLWSNFLTEFEQDDWMFQPQPFSSFSTLPIFHLQHPPALSSKGKERESPASEVDSTESSAQSPRLHTDLTPTLTTPDEPRASPTKDKSTTTKKSLLTAQEKKANHVASERRRREGIKDAYKELVDLLASEQVASLDPADAESKPKKKGRGRKGEGGATKSDVRSFARSCALEV